MEVQVSKSVVEETVVSLGICLRSKRLDICILYFA